MILVDKNIKDLGENLIISGYNENNVGPVSYDLTIEHIILDEEVTNNYELKPGETVFIKSIEEFKIPNHILGRIAEKNSRMRQGLIVAGPHYQPGHRTYAYLRVQNVSGNVIKIRKNMKIAQIIFEQLNSEPEKTYDKQKDAAFNDEEEYRGLGRYETEYSKDIKKYISAKEDLENKETKLYANILTLMGIFISMFSLIMVNFSSISEQNISAKYLWVINISLALVITVLMGLILIFINKAKSKVFLVIYCLLLISLIILAVVMGFYLV